MRIDFHGLKWHEFEDLVCDLLKEDGYTIEYQAGVGPDGGRDLIVSKTHDERLDKFTRRYVVQCKHYKGTVNRGKVNAIENTLLAENAEGFILAVSSRVSNPLMEMFNKITENSKYNCRVLQSSDIRDLLLKHEDIFRKWFPELHNALTDRSKAGLIMDKLDLVACAKEILGFEIVNGEAARLRKWAILFDVSSREALEACLRDESVRSLIDRLFQEKLGRSPYPFEVVLYLIRLAGEDDSRRAAILEAELIRNPDFLARAHIRIEFDEHPKCTIDFDAANQRALEFKTYHAKHAAGRLSIVDAKVMGCARAAEISCTSDAEFRLWLAADMSFPSKKILMMNFNFDGGYQIFVPIRSKDGKLCYIWYIPGVGADEETVDRGTVYAKVYSEASLNADVFRHEFYFADDLKRVSGIETDQLLGLILCTRGSLTIYNAFIE